MDDKTIKILSDVSVELAKEAYKDVAQPALKTMGNIFNMIPEAVYAKLAPLRKWIAEQEYSVDETVRILSIKLQNVSQDQIRSPEAYIGVPTLQYISYCVDSPELRDMYAELLAKSMNESTYKNVHPSFVEIIKQLCPDEAKILRIIDYQIPTIGLSYRNERYIGNEIISKFSDIGEKAKCEKDTDEALDKLSVKFGGKVSITFNKSFYFITDYDDAFIKTCIKSF